MLLKIESQKNNDAQNFNQAQACKKSINNSQLKRHQFFINRIFKTTQQKNAK